jgi:hypothetical protein
MSAPFEVSHLQSAVRSRPSASSRPEYLPIEVGSGAPLEEFVIDQVRCIGRDLKVREHV